MIDSPEAIARRKAYDLARRTSWPELGEALGVGIYGTVFLDANDPACVIKVRGWPARTPEALTPRAFYRQLRAVKSLRSPFVMTVHAYGARSGATFTEYPTPRPVVWYHGERLFPAKGFKKGLEFTRAAEKAGVFHDDFMLFKRGEAHHNIMCDAVGNLKFIDVEDVVFKRAKANLSDEQLLLAFGYG